MRASSAELDWLHETRQRREIWRSLACCRISRRCSKRGLLRYRAYRALLSLDLDPSAWGGLLAGLLASASTFKNSILSGSRHRVQLLISFCIRLQVFEWVFESILSFSGRWRTACSPTARHLAANLEEKTYIQGHFRKSYHFWESSTLALVTLF